MKLIVQIPCYNEAETVAQVISEVPRTIAGVDKVEVLVIDDGSSDGTIDVALAAGADHVLRNRSNVGLARTFERGLNACLLLGADVIVNTDGDNQYDGASIPDLVRPIVEKRAEIVLGDRDPGANREFSFLKRRLQRLGSFMVRKLSGVAVADAVSGFRAYSREAAIGTIVMTRFSYTTETLIHAGQRGIVIASVPVKTNPTPRQSRLASSMRVFIQKQLATLARSFAMYRPLHAFSILGLAMLLIGAIPIARFGYFLLIGEDDGHIQSLVLGSMFFIVGYLSLVLALVGDTIATNRQLLEASLRQMRRTTLALEREGGSVLPAPEGGEWVTQPDRQNADKR